MVNEWPNDGQILLACPCVVKGFSPRGYRGRDGPETNSTPRRKATDGFLLQRITNLQLIQYVLSVSAALRYAHSYPLACLYPLEHPYVTSRRLSTLRGLGVEHFDARPLGRGERRGAGGAGGNVHRPHPAARRTRLARDGRTKPQISQNSEKREPKSEDGPTQPTWSAAAVSKG